MKSDVVGGRLDTLKHTMVGLLAVLGAAWVSGCYQYVEVDPASVPVGARVRAELTSPGTQRLAGQIGADSGEGVEGRIVEMSPEGSLLLEVPRPSGDAPVGVPSRPLFSRVTLSQNELLKLELKKLDRGRTAALVGGGALLVGILVAVAYNTHGGGSEGTGPGVDQAVIPLFSIRW